MSNSATDIANLLYLYAENMDSGRLEEASELFRHARVHRGDGEVDHLAMLDTWRARVRLYPDGTPRTKHVVTNPIIEIDEAAGSATCRSYYTVLQSTPDLPLQVIASGRYHDEFERVDGHWRFSFRDYSLFDMAGDLSGHLLGDVPTS